MPADGRWRVRLALIVGAWATLIFGAVGGCSPFIGRSVSPDSLPGVSSAGPSPQEIKTYLTECANHINQFKNGAGLTYPRNLNVNLNDAAVFEAVINLNGASSPELIPNGTPTTTILSVKCEVTADLVVPPDESLKVLDSSGSNTRSFLPTGRVQWSWPVTGLKPGHHELQLVIEPALVIGEAVDTDPSSQKLNFVTDVNVNASSWQKAKLWLGDNWATILAGAGALGAAIVGLVRWLGSFGKVVGESKRDWTVARNPRRDDSGGPAPHVAARNSTEHTSEQHGDLMHPPKLDGRSGLLLNTVGAWRSCAPLLFTSCYQDAEL